jgi:hypothetical protein
MSSYTIYHKKYYAENKTDITTKNKENKYWEGYYEKNKEEVKKKALDRYYAKKAIKEEERKAEEEANKEINNNFLNAEEAEPVEVIEQVKPKRKYIRKNLKNNIV